MTKKIGSMVAAGITTFLPTMGVVHAQRDPFDQNVPTDLSYTNIGSYSNLMGTLNTITNWVLGILIALGVVFIIIAAFMYLTSGGDDTKVGNAKKYLTYAIIAIVIGLLSKGLVSLVTVMIGGIS